MPMNSSEWEEVYEGNFYGTLKSEINRVWNDGKNVIFDVDVKGGLNLKKYFGDDALAVFVKAPPMERAERKAKRPGYRITGKSFKKIVSKQTLRWASRIGSMLS
jgi:guanylate kinase